MHPGRSAVPEYRHTIFLNLYGVSDSMFSISFSKKRLELKSLKGQTKAEEEGTQGPFLLSLRLPLKAI